MAGSVKTRSDPVPKYIMPDGSEPEYERILKQLQDFRNPLIGRSYYYIRSGKEFSNLCRIVHGRGKVYFHEIVNHRQHGISDEDINEAVRQCQDFPVLSGYYPISSHIEMKLRALIDFD
jgi:hypothetical protein